jgi:hypothetical protein
MVVAVVLGVVIWLIMIWIKRRVAARAGGEDFANKLPKDFLEKPGLTKEIKMGAYAEARKKFLAEKKKLRTDILEEALTKHNVQKEYGYINTDCNEGAFALAEKRRKKGEAIRRMQRELDRRLEKEENGQNPDENSKKV